MLTEICDCILNFKLPSICRAHVWFTTVHFKVSSKKKLMRYYYFSFWKRLNIIYGCSVKAIGGFMSLL